MVLFSPLHGKSLTKRSKNLLAFHLRYRKNKNAEKIGVRLKKHPLSALARSANMFFAARNESCALVRIPNPQDLSLRSR
uniref:Uncharacterized protein n=1 Tax=Candidatus Kentrum sp. TUN TaxID=2126343 RepID=A0A450ZWL2_9GAMM|nr:MAG: hypothetical protein BECKTUN1418D_GA0071000_10773 [Candidatus Kentron sp. TUN]